MRWEDLFQGYDDTVTTRTSLCMEEATTQGPEGLRPAEQQTHEGPTFPPLLGAPWCRPIVTRQISEVLGEILRAQFVLKTWKEIYHGEMALKATSWALREIMNTCNQIIFTMAISKSSYFLVCFYNSSGKGIFLYPMFQISTAELRRYTHWNIQESKKIPIYCCFLQPSVLSLQPLPKSHSHILLAAMTPCCHLIRCGVPHGMNKYLSTTAY